MEESSTDWYHLVGFVQEQRSEKSLEALNKVCRFPLSFLDELTRHSLSLTTAILFGERVPAIPINPPK